MNLTEQALVHAALGDEYRLAIVRELEVGDHTPGDLAVLLGLPTNLLAHHVNVLEQAGLVERRVSEGDHRRRYLVFRHETLWAVGVGSARPAGRVVFVCTHNSARSQYAAAVYGQHTGEQTNSAGRTPADRVHPLAVRVAAERGIDLSGAVPAGYDSLEGSFDLVVSVCDRAGEDETVPAGRHIHWSVPDPVAAGGVGAFRRTFDDVDRRMAAWIRP